MSRAKLLTPGLRLLLTQGSLQKSELYLRHLAGFIQQAEPLHSLALVLNNNLTNVAMPLTFASRQFSAAAAGKGSEEAAKKRAQQEQQSLVEAEEEFSAITDKIPQRPVSVAEGTSYTLVIIAALGFAAAVIYAALNELVFAPKEYQCYTKTVNKIKDDPRVTVRLGTPISAYGVESRNRAARQRIPHRIFNDSEGREHIQLQFHLRGPSGRATVNADMYKEGSEWRYNFLFMDVESPIPQQVVFIRPGQDDYAV